MEAINVEAYGDRHGFEYLASLTDGEGFTGRARRIARRLGVAQDHRDRALFDAHGGRDRVAHDLTAAWSDPKYDLRDLDAAQERLLLMTCIDRAHVAPVRVTEVDALVGHGVFATAAIRARDVIGEYTGILRTSRPEDWTNHYLAQTPPYGDITDLIIDGRAAGNVTRFINHGGRSANVSNQFVFHARRWHRVLRADRDIRPGEQILWDYGPEYWRYREAPADL